MKYLPPKFNVMFKFNYFKIIPRGLFSGEGGGGLYMEGVLRFIGTNVSLWALHMYVQLFNAKLDQIKI